MTREPASRASLSGYSEPRRLSGAHLVCPLFILKSHAISRPTNANQLVRGEQTTKLLSLRRQLGGNSIVCWLVWPLVVALGGGLASAVRMRSEQSIDLYALADHLTIHHCNIGLTVELAEARLFP